MCKFGWHRCAVCEQDIMETYIRCDKAIKKGWQGMNKCRKCPLYEPWTPPPQRSCAPCSENEKVVRNERRKTLMLKAEQMDLMESVGAVIIGGGSASVMAKEGETKEAEDGNEEDEETDDEYETEIEVEWWDTTKTKPTVNQEEPEDVMSIAERGESSFLKETEVKQQALSLTTMETRDTVWEDIERDGDMTARSEAARAEALRDARAGKSVLRKKKCCWVRRWLFFWI